MGVRQVGKALGRGLLALFLIWAATLVCVALVQMIWPRLAGQPATADVIVCLGAGLGSDDGEPVAPDRASARRAHACAALHQAGVAPQILFTGASHRGGSPAVAMAELAESLSVPPEAIITETRSNSTIQNAAFFLPLLSDPEVRIVLVSDAFHLPRAWLIFRAMGAEDLTLHPAPTRFPDPPDAGLPLSLWVVRESAAIWFNVWRAGLYTAAGWLGFDHDTRIDWFD